MCSAICQTVRCNPGDDLYFKNKVVSIGTVPVNRNRTVVVYEIYNRTQEQIYIKSIKSSCGCTTVNYSRDIIKPGERRKIYVTVSTMYKIGYFNESILVRLNDNSPHILRIKGIKPSHNTNRNIN